MRRAAKIDDNQTEIVKALRKMGCSVSVTSAVGSGFSDLVVGYRGTNFLVEIKDGSKPPSKQKLTPDQVEFHRYWRGQVAVANSIDEAIRIVTTVCRKTAE